MTSPLKVHIMFTPNKSCILLGTVSTKVVQRIVKFQILDFCHFVLSFSSTWDHKELKTYDISPERTHQICSKNPCILLGRLSTKLEL